ncbi:MAG: hypothetical protein GXP26_02510 [Planctomycetes bacterium]|nr:hypothetical protein [Planctomycetota bacterium]
MSSGVEPAQTWHLSEMASVGQVDVAYSDSVESQQPVIDSMVQFVWKAHL